MEVVVDCILLASGRYLIKGRSNVSEASLLFNPVMNYTLLGYEKSGARFRNQN
jgi:hypothetical protein